MAVRLRTLVYTNIKIAFSEVLSRYHKRLLTAFVMFIPLFVWKEKNRVSTEAIISIYLFVTQICRQSEVKRFISDGMMGVEVSN